MHKVTMLGTGLIGMFYTMTLHGQRNRDRVEVVYSRAEERAKAFAEEWNIPHWTTDLSGAINHPASDSVVIGLPNHMHEDLVARCAAAGKAILCTKPLARNAAEAKRMLDTIEEAGVFGGYLEDLCYTPKTLKALKSVLSGALGKITWARWVRSPGRAHERPSHDLTAPGSGMWKRQAVGRFSILAATVSRSSATL